MAIEMSTKGSTLLEQLQHMLNELHQNPYPEVPNPPSCGRRASVALVLRIRPTYGNWPDSVSSQTGNSRTSTTERLDQFFSQSWVQHGDPECVFIKRAARVGDRWTRYVDWRVRLKVCQNQPLHISKKSIIHTDTSDIVT